jgi:predicted N-formylglutamate amidohydrolase
VARRLRPEGLPIPANVHLDTRGRRERLERFWWPWRRSVAADLDGIGRPLHLSIHSFTDQLTPAHEPRGNDFALMYWPDRRAEHALADRLHEALAARGHSVRRNWPYSGREDGYCMRLRVERPERRYVGMEIEINQKLCGTRRGAERVAELLGEVLAAELAAPR